MPPLSAFARYTSSFIGATFLTSFAFRGLIHKRTSSTERDRLTAHETILQSLVARTRAGEHVSEGEVGRLLRLARGGGDEGESGEGAEARDVPWREVVFGRRVKEDEALEVARREWDAAVAQDLPSAKSAVKLSAPIVSTPVSLVSSVQPAKQPTFL